MESKFFWIIFTNSDINCTETIKISAVFSIVEPQMSDEFMKVATKEVSDEIHSISKILGSCKSDEDISKNVVSIEKHIHKIKGLAPMMGQNEIGEISASIDKILKHMLKGNKIKNSHLLLSESALFMESAIKGDKKGFEKIKQKVETNYANILD